MVKYLAQGHVPEKWQSEDSVGLGLEISLVLGWHDSSQVILICSFKRVEWQTIAHMYPNPRFPRQN